MSNNSKLQLYLLREVISKAKKDPLSKKLTIHLNDYIFLNLSQSATKLLQKLCQDYDIDLEQLPPRMKVEETQRLMKEYIKLKKEIEEAQDSSVIKEADKLLSVIKEKITLGHMQIVVDLINKNIKDIQSAQDREDIYQMGYEILLKLIESYDDTKNATFLYYLNRYFINRLNIKILSVRKGINLATANAWRKIVLASSKLQIQKINEETIKELSKQAGIGEKRVEAILRTIKLSRNIEIDSFEDEYPEDLIYETFEEDAIDRILKKNDHINKLLATLDPIEREIISLYYGFEDGKCHTLEEISQIVKTVSRERVRQQIVKTVSRERVRQIKERGLVALTIREKGKYLKSIYGDSPYFYESTGYQREASKEQLQELLIKALPSQVLKELTADFDPVMVEVLMLYYGLQDDEKLDYAEICLRFKYSMGKIYSMETIRRLKKQGTNLLFEKMSKRLNPNFKGDPLVYMTNYYLNEGETPKIKKRA